MALVLLQRGTHIHAKDDGNWTPLHWACMNGHAEVAIALLQQGADVNHKGKDGRSEEGNEMYKWDPN